MTLHLYQICVFLLLFAFSCVSSNSNEIVPIRDASVLKEKSNIPDERLVEVEPKTDVSVFREKNGKENVAIDEEKSPDIKYPKFRKGTDCPSILERCLHGFCYKCRCLTDSDCPPRTSCKNSCACVTG